MNDHDVKKRMMELMEPINRQIMMCDNREELLMLASCMLVSVKDLFDNEIGVEGRKKMFKEYV
jgi:hypothetical protein